MTIQASDYLEPSPFNADGGELIGRRPAEMPIEALRNLGHPQSPMKAIQAKCLDCVFNEAEVRKCVQLTCALWPLRMGRNPFHGKPELPPAETAPETTFHPTNCGV